MIKTRLNPCDGIEGERESLSLNIAAVKQTGKNLSREKMNGTKSEIFHVTEPHFE